MKVEAHEAFELASSARLRRTDHVEVAMARELNKKRADAEILQERLLQDALEKADGESDRAERKQKSRCLWQEKLNFSTRADGFVGKLGGFLEEFSSDKNLVEADLQKLVVAPACPDELKTDVDEAIKNTGILSFLIPWVTNYTFRMWFRFKVVLIRY